VRLRLLAGLGVGLGLWLGAGRVCADATVSGAAGQSQPLLDSGVSARAMGLGNALAAVDQDGTALWFNPAGLAGQDVMALGLHHDNELVDALRETAVLGLPLGTGQGAAFAVDYVNYGDFAATNDQGLADGSFSASELGLLAGYGFKLGGGLSLGGQARYGRQQLADVTQSLWEGTGGLQLRPWDGALSLGLAWTVEQDAVLGWQTSAVNLGLAWMPLMNGERPVSVSLQGQRLTLDRSQITVAVEWQLSSVATLRGAWQEALYQQSAAGAMGIWCVGAGIGDGIWSLDYGVITDHPLGFAQRLSLGYAFGPPQPPAPPTGAADQAEFPPLPQATPAAQAVPMTAPLPAGTPAPATAPAPTPAAAAQYGMDGALPSSAYVQAFQAVASGKLTDALALCRDAVAADPGDALCWRELGLVYEKLGRSDYARPCMAACLRLRPRDADALQWMQDHGPSPGTPGPTVP
jgi:hypothetical protein